MPVSLSTPYQLPNFSEADLSTLPWYLTRTPGLSFAVSSTPFSNPFRELGVYFASLWFFRPGNSLFVTADRTNLSPFLLIYHVNVVQARPTPAASPRHSIGFQARETASLLHQSLANYPDPGTWDIDKQTGGELLRLPASSRSTRIFTAIPHTKD